MVSRNRPIRPTASPAARVFLAFSIGACCVAALNLAFSLGRQWPVQGPPQTGARSSSLDDVRRHSTIPLAELDVDRGNQIRKPLRLSPALNVASEPNQSETQR